MNCVPLSPINSKRSACSLISTGSCSVGLINGSSWTWKISAEWRKRPGGNWMRSDEMPSSKFTFTLFLSTLNDFSSLLFSLNQPLYGNDFSQLPKQTNCSEIFCCSRIYKRLNSFVARLSFCLCLSGVLSVGLGLPQIVPPHKDNCVWQGKLIIECSP